jgi:hypothetical protein
MEGGGWLGDERRTKPSSIAVSLPPIRNARSVFLFFAADVVWSKAIWVPWSASICFQRVSYLVSLPTLCALASALERRLQSVGWSPRLLHFFQLLLAELGVARRRGSGGSVGVVLLVLVLGEGLAYFRPFLAVLDAGEDVEVLELLVVGVVAVHVERPPHLHREAGVITNRRSNIDGEK